jgi:hypothetical protein
MRTAGNGGGFQRRMREANLDDEQGKDGAASDAGFQAGHAPHVNIMVVGERMGLRMRELWGGAGGVPWR